MSNKERLEMTNNIGIDLNSIPHPKDCYPVPDGETIPAGTPFWLVVEQELTWWGNGLSYNLEVDRGRGLVLIPEPIIPHPTPDDSPIIITRTSISRAVIAAGTLAVWMPGDREWCAVGKNGYSRWLDSNEITEWAPAIVTKSGRGVWDERDKRDRIDADGYIWKWSSVRAIWVCDDVGDVGLGSLSAFRECYGEHCLTRVYGEESDEE